MNVGYHSVNPIVSDPSLESLRCWVCSDRRNLLRCSRCRSIYYCGPQHQQIDWQRHRTFCRPLVSPDLHMSQTMAQTAVDLQTNAVADTTGLLMADIGSNSGQIPSNDLNPFNGIQSMNGLVDSNQNHENFLSRLNSYCDLIVRDLNEFGFCVIDDFLENGSEILSEVLLMYTNGRFKAGQVVNNKVMDTHMIRGDHIAWVDGTEQDSVNIGFLAQSLDYIIMRCNTSHTSGQLSKYLIKRRTKAMIACYPGNNSKYVRHIDNPNNDGRCVTCIYYLNKDYNRERDGGVLRLFPQSTQYVADIEPKFNRVIFFWSDRRNPHEVMPSARMRFAITVWYFDAIERERALQRFRQERIEFPVDKDLRPF